MNSILQKKRKDVKYKEGKKNRLISKKKRLY